MEEQREYLIVEDRDGVRLISFNRPKALNALNKPLLMELEQELLRTGDDSDIDVVVLTGAGKKSFVAGADIEQMSEFGEAEAIEFASLGHRVLALIERMPQIVIAAVNGYALGGGTELALACDFIYASENAAFGQPEVKLGLIPGFGGTQRLMRKIHSGMARELIAVGEHISARAALQIGLVNRVIEDGDDLIEAVMKVAQKIRQRSPLAVTVAKRAMLDGAHLSLPDACALEIAAFGQLFISDHPREGTTAFLTKRAPQFSQVQKQLKQE